MRLPASVFPFSAITGQEDAKHALLLSAVDPSIGGVLIFGDRGTGKSTVVRALAQLLPKQKVVRGCPYRCHPDAVTKNCELCRASKDAAITRTARETTPVVDLPLGSTEDRIIGTLDLEKALTQGIKTFQPGLLAQANRGYLYIDEINLLEDHLVDLLLDVAASGENLVERDGLSLRHAARFVLVGSGNPEEGELRPQLLDRFGLAIDVATPGDIKTRVEIVRRRSTYDLDPEGFVTRYKRKDASIRRKILSARDRLPDVTVSDQVLETTAALCLKVKSDGLRGELTLVRAAKATAALDGAIEVTDAHLQRVARMALRHRLRRDPMDESGSDARIDRAVSETFAPVPKNEDGR
ncbi:MAG: magnesium chelatase ATPase subunit I [Rhodospirillaceae bacterium]|nr:magnesium chelatase ATPase subunit I [Rhodospirillaceae bacterium]